MVNLYGRIASKDNFFRLWCRHNGEDKNAPPQRLRASSIVSEHSSSGVSIRLSEPAVSRLGSCRRRHLLRDFKWGIISSFDHLRKVDQL